MALPQTYKAFRHSKGNTPTTLEMVTEELPSSLKPTEVLIRIHAVSLNYRDAAIMHGKYPAGVTEQGIPTSDCAAEVIKIGSEVDDFQIGDRVAPIFDLNNIDGTEEEKVILGGDVDGVLREYAVFDRNVLFHLPKHLSWEEAACITCAGTTAWNALDMPRSKGTALLQGTGGVSMFSLLICVGAGIRPIITSSSDRKLDQAKAIAGTDAVDTINYRDHPEWEEEARSLTNGRGVNVVVDNVGPSSIAQSLSSLARRGTVSLVGFLGGFDTEQFPDTVIPTLMKSATIRGINVGSKADHQSVCDFLSEKNISLKPILDTKAFSFEDAPAAFDHLWDAKHMGKVVIKF
ncbi:hypothetical protein PENANT_c002G10727 [Penicillium antarcticum]|uniref:Enoyl reductase (ER) domain-containing protein n=1 Tax=Penicillium antarcticum TaxID=416450 RepID=A0A1V6QLK3_9EURO|nr:uncharacterized protein N7508_006444 [Penicillium antarcticum]KAJ5301581.1 hypothetical protein N7508_006444 [Penicillium antarcticum]OQD89852.1 hypothetical protein PENANT_c002G10727 [Penicillium antarcticum]